jgi:hypothetical protein
MNATIGGELSDGLTGAERAVAFRSTPGDDTPGRRRFSMTQGPIHVVRIRLSGFLVVPSPHRCWQTESHESPAIASANRPTILAYLCVAVIGAAVTPALARFHCLAVLLVDDAGTSCRRRRPVFHVHQSSSGTNSNLGVSGALDACPSGEIQRGKKA